MLEQFKPDWMIETVYQITPEMLKKHNIKAVFADLDNTLIAWNNPNGTPELREWIKNLKAHEIPVVIVSNNSNKRVKIVAELLGLGYVSRAFKPLTAGIKRASRKIGVPIEECVMIGDQLITDIQGANRAGVRTILVRPIIDSDAWNTRLNRFIERYIMRYLLKKNPDMKWRNECD
ncbi:5-amino-6-(5-phospho-D-ribitylamino)uracil phosphatase YigB [Jeotgalibaca dankookensis]|uniref:5-amino-6-(5-phospho-D-ribitylamino)uracil phosphatase YigB n=1 Tax=Jeotgalibaca dankookensis TaxID=708126 RepID=A0A1S6IMP2_9LACT|nr:YqeG family HAD IIIA-type phosphatase [Jeotgalibaca dankookensis]AQS52818.1 5-amino-6-(5-phospho-D-ribitylamino)uracil phosphatase YigB [Jeotgalibaca dankookensis]